MVGSTTTDCTEPFQKLRMPSYVGVLALPRQLKSPITMFEGESIGATTRNFSMRVQEETKCSYQQTNQKEGSQNYTEWGHATHTK